MDNNLSIEFNKQINREFSSAYIYYAMSSYFSEINFDGFAKYMKNAAIEELEHAQKFYDFLILRHAKIQFDRIEAPEMNYANAVDVLYQAVEHEKYITSEIVKLSEKSKEMKDYMAEIFLQGMIMEQMEEEDKFLKILERIQYNGECGCTLEHIDSELR